MTNLVFNGENGQALTNSLLVAEKFGKEHRNVLSSIRELIKGCAENSAVLSMFVESQFINGQNKEQPMFVMTRDGFTLLAMGFTGKKALQFKLDFINAFNTMEKQLRQSSCTNVLEEIERQLLQASRSWLDYMGQLQGGAKTKMNLPSYVSLAPSFNDSMTTEQKISQLIHFISNNVNGALYAHSRMIELEEELKNKTGERALDNLYELFNNPRHYSKKYFFAVMDGLNAFLSEEFHRVNPTADTVAKLESRIAAARVLYVKEEDAL
ncbi:MAG: Rha family transcriptional regulator [Parabacteroides sp.]|nr:Rha family transcriptional regulator [Parabacteroides sp.]